MHAGHDACRGDGLSAPTRNPGARDQRGAQSSPAPSPEVVSRSAHPCAQGWGSSMAHSNAEPGDGREGDTAQLTLRPQPLDHCLGQGPPAPGQGCYLGLLRMTAGRHWVTLRSPSWFGEQAVYRKVRARESEARSWAGTEERQGCSAGLAPKLPGRSVWRGGPWTPEAMDTPGLLPPPARAPGKGSGLS